MTEQFWRRIRTIAVTISVVILVGIGLIVVLSR